MKNTKSVWIFGLVIIAAFVMMFIFRSPGPANLPLPTNAPTPTEILADDRTLGSREAIVTLMEYSDFECPACAAYHPIVSQLMETESYRDRLLFVYRHFPLVNSHRNAHLAARASEAAGRQGKFWEMHDRLFSEQKMWAGREAMSLFLNYATELGLDMAQFQQDIDTEEITTKVQRDLASGQKAKITGTPTFFINGIKIENPQSLDEFKAEIDSRLATDLGDY